MEELFIWFNKSTEASKGIPFPLNTMLTEEFNPKRPMPGFDYPWVAYNPYKMDFPPDDSRLKLPEHLFLVVKKEKEVLFDFLCFKNEYKIVSEPFLNYIQQHGATKGYEIASLSVVSNTGKPIAEKQYFALRFARFDDALISFNEASKQPVPNLRNRFVYEDVKKQPDAAGDVFFVDDFCYRETVLLTKKAKADVERLFYKPSIYSAKDFVKVYQADNSW